MSLFGYASKEYHDERGRDYFFDNAKFILIFLVVLAHATSPLKTVGGTDMKGIKTIWTIINTLHMPCLIFISGYFAKGYIKNGVVKTRRLVTYVVYYLAAQLFVSLFEYYVLGYSATMSRSVFAPRSSLWYLMCLIWWFGFLPYIYKLKPSFIIPASFIVAFLIGYDTKACDFLSVARMVNHFPFFIIGYYFKKDWLFKFRKLPIQIAMLAVSFGISVWAYFNIADIPSRIITSNFNYYEANLKYLDTEPLMFLNRLIFYIIAGIFCFTFLLWVPRGKAFFTRFGSRTLQVYILHRFLYLAELEYQWYKPFVGTRTGYIEMCLIALALTLILSLKPFEYPFKWLSKINLKRFEKSEEEVKV